MKPEVSILLPSYNYEAFIRKAIDSVLDQSFTNWELIIIDDGSKDNSVEIIKTYKDKRIHLFVQENQGVTKTLNKGLKLSKGRFICFLDADDKYHPDKLMAQIEAMNAGFDIVTSKVQAIDGNDENSPLEHFNESWNLYDKNEIFGKDMIYKFLHKNYFCKYSLMIQRDLFEKYGDFNTELLTAYDLELWLRMLKKAKVTRVDSILTYYRWHDKNETSVNNNRIRVELILILDKYIQEMNKVSTHESLLKSLESINSCFQENNLLTGYLALQMVKPLYKINNNYRIFNESAALDLLYKAINNFYVNPSRTEEIAPQQPRRLRRLWRIFLPIKLRSFIKKLFKIK